MGVAVATLTGDNPIYINSTMDGGYLRIEGKAWDNLLSTNTGAYWLNTKLTRCIGEGAYWGYYMISGHNLMNSGSCYVYTSFGGSSGTHGVRPVVTLKSNVKLSGNSTDGWTLNDK